MFIRRPLEIRRAAAIRVLVNRRPKRRIFSLPTRIGIGSLRQSPVVTRPVVNLARSRAEGLASGYMSLKAYA